MQLEMVVPNTFEDSEIRNSKVQSESERMVDALGLTIVNGTDIVEEDAFLPDQELTDPRPKKSFKLFFKR